MNLEIVHTSHCAKTCDEIYIVFYSFHLQIKLIKSFGLFDKNDVERGALSRPHRTSNKQPYNFIADDPAKDTTKETT